MNLTESEIVRRALEWHEAGRGVAVCTVIETWGAGPRPVGSRLIVDGDGAFIGSVSGGCVESDVIAEAIDVVESAGQPRLLEFGVSDGLAWKAGLTCGGQIRVYVERLDAPLAACLQHLMREFAARRPAVLVTELDGTPPRVVTPDALAGQPLAPQVEEIFRTGRSTLVALGERQVFLGAMIPATRLVVVGAVHIAQALATLARVADLEMIVVDPRTAFATPDRFADLRLIAAWPNDAAAELRLDRTDAVAIISHDPKIDDQGLQLAMQAGCFYIGALGSRRSHAKRLERLRAAGVAEPDLQRIHAPIGLDIGAEGAAEIAVAILAEVILERRRMPLGAAAAVAA